MKKTLTIIIGLPGSGKSHIMKKFEDHIIFDDFIGSFYDGKLIKALLQNNKVCSSDPRMCLSDIFNRFINKILQYIKKSEIYLILFENDPEQCLKIIKYRHDGKQSIEETIKNYSKYYDLNNYKKFEHEIVSVFK